MRRGVGTFVGLLASAALLAGCPAGQLAPSLPPGVSPPVIPSGLPTPNANADLYGVVSFDDHSSFTNPPEDPNGSGSDAVLATVVVSLVRNPGADGEFVDSGSTFSARTTSHREVSIGIPACLGVSDSAGEVQNRAFGPGTAPDDPGSEISAIYSPELGFFTLYVNTSQPLVQNINACMAGQAKTQTIYVSGALGCGSFGLGGAVTRNPAGPDTIDMTCFLKNAQKEGSVTVSGTLTLKD